MEEQKGFILVFTGNGKGKTTAALGTALRCLGYDYPVCMIQFMKGDWHYGELEAAKRLAPAFELYQMGKGFYHIEGDKYTEKEHQQAAENALLFAFEKMKSEKYRLIILDEVLVAVKFNLLKEESLLNFIHSKPKAVHLVLTGRGASKTVIDYADLVTEMREIKHPYQQGIKSIKGIDY
ncbi:MAG: cob(I)yrinic acid a,c-diamide adenosyltransferase [Candidatus Marinimicrobia bacterium]|nr:cob(I)yrinic acid a,c-diamide adenosyltransferase [Candidatus Neomarinimicrobiota bacterium]